MEIKSVSILGCGWFGWPFAKHLTAKRYQVKGSTTSEQKLKELEHDGMKPFLIDFSQNVDLPADFFNTDVLLINVPPRAKSTDVTNYANNLKRVADAAKGNVKHLVFISSTGVFEDGNFEVNEADDPQPTTEAGKALLEAENLWSAYPQFSVTIIRFAGLIGPGRNLAKFFAGKTDIANGRAPINLITLEDCIGLCTHLIETQKFGEIYHAVVPDHPTRAAFYTKLCQVSGMPTAHFKNELLDWKKINSTNVPEKLGYQFKVQNWFEWLTENPVL
jgi:nucleoside-diphosphate-sugar epimerase